MNEEQKLEKWAERELKRNLAHLIVSDDDGGFIAFGKYHIGPAKIGFTVSTFSTEIHTFMNKRHAISWCVADHNDQIMLAHRIKALDEKKQILSADLQVRRLLSENGRTDGFCEVVSMKIQPKIETLNMLNSELEKCMSLAKYLQIKGFTNETARTSRA